MSFNPLFGRTIGINVDMKVLDDASHAVKEDAVIYAGRPVALVATPGVDAGKVVAVTTNVAVRGLSKANKNSYVNETRGATGMYGSGQITMVMNGIVTLKHNVFTQSDGSDVVVKTFDDSKTYECGQALYVDCSATPALGLITNDTTANANTLIGYVLKTPAMLGETALQVRLML